MRIVTLVKQILDPRGITVRRDKERIFVNREEYILDPGSKAAIEAALQLRGADDEITALSTGKPQAEDALREALAMGCDTAYLLSDKAFKEADITVTTRILAAAVKKLGGADLVIAGRASGDTGAGQLGPRLAEALGYAQVTDVYALTAADGKAQATRRWGNATEGGGAYAAVETALPAVVTVAPEAFPPRYAHGVRIMNAYREWEMTTWDAADLDLDEAALKPQLIKRSESFPPSLEIGEQFRGDAANVAQDVVMGLKLQKLVG
jgi:electron transfer flavoprotein alpha/beta subunit